MTLTSQLVEPQRPRETSRPRTKLKPAVLGATGYAGQELIRLLSRHPGVAAPALLNRPGDDVQEDFAISSREMDWREMAENGVGLLFLATPHAVSRKLVPEALTRGLRVIDLSGAWRLKQPAHRAVYEFKDDDPAVAEECTTRAIYGLPELHRDAIAGADLVANPGCYATSVILALAPLLKAGYVDLARGIISDSKSGVTGAGKALTERTQFVSVADNLSAYSLFTHRHVGEIAEQLAIGSPDLTFTPHLLPVPRGILSTIYVRLHRRSTIDAMEKCFRDFYAREPWVRIYAAGGLPEIRFSLQTNYCDIGFRLAEDGLRLIVISCLDNLLKGAAGQAVQNMNLMYGWDEKEGLL